MEINNNINDSPGHKKKGIFYGWWIVLVSAMAMAMVISPIFQGLGTFFVSFERHFGWSRTVLSGAFSLSRAEGAILGPLEGILIDKFGSRKCIIVGLIILGLAFMGLSLTKGIVDFYIYFLIVFFGAGIGGFMPIMAAINNWFIKRRTLAMAVGMAGVNLGGLLVPVLAWVIVTVGWRTAAFSLGSLVLLLIIPLAIVIRNKPEDLGMEPDGGVDESDPEHSIDSLEHTSFEDTDFTLKEALQTSAFWVITIAHSASSMAIITISVHLIPALTDIGMSLQMAGTVVAIYTSAGFAFQLISGYLGDKLPKPPLIAFFTAIQAVAMIILATVPTTAGVFAFAVIFGIGFGGRIPVLLSIRGEYFGRKNFATIVGVGQLPMNIAMMVAPVATGYVYDTTGSYMIPFISLGILCFLGAILIMYVKKPSHKPDSTQNNLSL